MSRELRTPLASILGWTRLLRRGGLAQEKQSRALETLERNARAQTRLVEDLLDVSRIVSGKTRLNVETADLARIVESAVESIRPGADSRGIQLQASVQPCALAGDPERLQQVLWNLLNAVKFTPRGGRVSVAMEVRERTATVTVQRPGQGIPANFLPHVFERFRQADRHRDPAPHGGLGLGLAIVRHLVELHGGTVTATSPGEGRGAAFALRLPLGASVALERPADEGMPVQLLNLAGLRLLVVDDEPDIRDVVASTLEAHGAEVVPIGDAEEALRWLTSNSADLLVSDVAMPGMDGCALIREIRRTGPGSPRHPGGGAHGLCSPRGAPACPGRGVPGLPDEAGGAGRARGEGGRPGEASRGGLRSARREVPGCMRGVSRGGRKDVGFP